MPGNTAAVSSLTEAVNRGLDPSVLEQDPRWSDVNVISSLLKSFFRRLPDSLLTSELYPLFIEADKIDDPILRIVTIRKLVSLMVLLYCGWVYHEIWYVGSWLVHDVVLLKNCYYLRGRSLSYKLINISHL